MSAHKTTTTLHHLVALLSRESDQLLLEQLGIGLSQYKILTTLHEHPHVQQRAIAAALGQTEASISRQIKLLKEKGMLVSPRNPINRREHIADLTARGLRIIEAAEAILDNYHRTFFSNLNQKQHKQLDELLGNIHKSVCQLQH